MLVVLNELRDQNLMFIVYEAQGRDLGPIGTSCSVYFMVPPDWALCPSVLRIAPDVFQMIHLDVLFNNVCHRERSTSFSMVFLCVSHPQVYFCRLPCKSESSTGWGWVGRGVE